MMHDQKVNIFEKYRLPFSPRERHCLGSPDNRQLSKCHRRKSPDKKGEFRYRSQRLKKPRWRLKKPPWQWKGMMGQRVSDDRDEYI